MCIGSLNFINKLNQNQMPYKKIEPISTGDVKRIAQN
jgi:hypothetical protein